jgi:Peptidase C39 family
MIVIFIVCVVFFCLGIVVGKNLAVRGINADKSLDKHKTLLLVGFVTVAIVFTLLFIVDRYNIAYLLPKVFPSSILLFLGGYFNNFVLYWGCSIIGLLVALEVFGRSHIRQKIQLSFALIAISYALVYHLHYLLPIGHLVTRSIIYDDVVIQTTPYTCAPASIATLVRLVGNKPNFTEKDAIELTQTNRFGTTTLAEIKALDELGLQPQYAHNLTIKDLIARNQPALLHVKEKYRGQLNSHAVALLEINTPQQLITIANPLYGKQVKTFQEMNEYWFGEAIFVN